MKNFTGGNFAILQVKFPVNGAAATGLMQRVFEQHVRRGDLVDNAEIDGLAPEFGKPAAYDSLVIFFFAHWNGSL
jgi:hypothetical protein